MMVINAGLHSLHSHGAIDESRVLRNIFRLPLEWPKCHEAFLIGSRSWFYDSPCEWPYGVPSPTAASPPETTDWDFCTLAPTVSRVAFAPFGPQSETSRRMFTLFGIDKWVLLNLGDYATEGRVSELPVVRFHFYGGQHMDVLYEPDREIYERRRNQHHRLARVDKSGLLEVFGRQWDAVSGSARYAIACRLLLNEEPI